MSDTITHLYRFRPLSHLLDGYHELEREEIYFASPDELNDPLEGLRDILWQGDEIVWENLFRHYLLCLDRAFGLLAVCGQGDKPSFGWEHISVLNIPDPNPTSEAKALHASLLKTFFDEPVIQSYIEILASRKQPVRRSELCIHIRNVHQFAFAVIYQNYERHGFMPERTGITTKMRKDSLRMLRLAEVAIPRINQAEVEHPDLIYGMDAFFTFQGLIQQQMRTILYSNRDIDLSKPNRNFVFIEFPDQYIKEIESLLYYPWYTACFMEGCRDSSTWSGYADRHEGVCLKFKVRQQDGEPSMRVSFVGNEHSRHFMDCPFHRVVYTKDHVQVDFFRSIGRYSLNALRANWYTDRNGRLSACAKGISPSDFAQTHWDKFYSGSRVKLEAWGKEQEYRLIVPDMLQTMATKDSRKAKYDFADLDGIIFGMRTPMKEKLQISKIVEEKCRRSGRTDFKFYQAYHSREKGTIEHHEMGLLKFNWSDLERPAAEAAGIGSASSV